MIMAALPAIFVRFNTLGGWIIKAANSLLHYTKSKAVNHAIQAEHKNIKKTLQEAKGA